MKNCIIQWAQALDNRSFDHIAVDGRSLASSNTREVHLALETFQRAAMPGRHLYDSSTLRMLSNRRRFVLVVAARERDSAGRPSNSLISGPVSSLRDPAFEASLPARIAAFALIAGRTPAEGFESEIRIAAAVALRDRQMWLLRNAAFAALFTAATVITALLLSFGVLK